MQYEKLTFDRFKEALASGRYAEGGVPGARRAVGKASFSAEEKEKAHKAINKHFEVEAAAPKATKAKPSKKAAKKGAKAAEKSASAPKKAAAKPPAKKAAKAEAKKVAAKAPDIVGVPKTKKAARTPSVTGIVATSGLLQASDESLTTATLMVISNFRQALNHDDPNVRALSSLEQTAYNRALFFAFQEYAAIPPSEVARGVEKSLKAPVTLPTAPKTAAPTVTSEASTKKSHVVAAASTPETPRIEVPETVEDDDDGDPQSALIRRSANAALRSNGLAPAATVPATGNGG
jgi:hypothetical protein